MSALDALLILLAGVGAGTINSIVGSGTLITFPTLLFLGYPPLMANVSKDVYKRQVRSCVQCPRPRR